MSKVFREYVHEFDGFKHGYRTDVNFGYFAGIVLIMLFHDKEVLSKDNKDLAGAFSYLEKQRSDFLSNLISELKEKDNEYDKVFYQYYLSWKNPKTIEDFNKGDKDLCHAKLKSENLCEAHLEKANLVGTHLEKANLKEAHLEEAELTYAHLEEANLEKAYLEKAELYKAHLEKANLMYAHLEKATLSGAHLEEASIFEAHLKEADLTYAHLEKAYLDNAHLEKANLENAHLEKANLPEAHLEEANLTDANLEEAYLSNAHLEKANLNQANLEKANLYRAHLEEANLYRADLEGAIFFEAHLEGANLNQAVLTEADLRGAHLEKANLSATFLDKADLEEAHLEGATLEKAHLGGANLNNAHLEGADFQYARLKGANLDRSNWEGAENVDLAYFDIYKRPAKKETPDVATEEAPPYCSSFFQKFFTKPENTSADKNQQTKFGFYQLFYTEPSASKEDLPASCLSKLCAKVAPQTSEEKDDKNVQDDNEDEPPSSAFLSIEESVVTYRWYVPLPNLKVLYRQMMLVYNNTNKMLSDKRDELNMVEDLFKRVFDYETRKDNWREVIPLWILLYNLYDKVENPVAKYALQNLYADDIEKVIGMGLQMKVTRGDAPEGLMLRLKSLTEHLRLQFIDTQLILNDEEGRVDAVKELRSSLETRIFALIVALGIGIANFISSYVYDNYVLQ